ncbi:MAG TPA: VOC family protein [Pyrinomonadaceae bacterium]|nr:VOC family protein [Pyrinomonadaceae bacterium]
MTATAPATARKLLNIAPYFIVEDVIESAEFYRDKLGFHFDGYRGDPPSYVVLVRDNVWIILEDLNRTGLVCPNRKVNPPACWDAYVLVENVDGLYKEFKSKGVKIIRSPEKTDYDMIEMEVEDCNGYVLCFGQDLMRS